MLILLEARVFSRRREKYECGKVKKTPVGMGEVSVNSYDFLKYIVYI